MTNTPKKSKRRRGTALTELAVTVPFLFLLTMGATDFGRLFYTSLTVTHAAGVASEYGAQNVINSVQYSTMQTIAVADALEIPNTTATATHKCRCTANGADVSCALDTCGGEPPRVYVRVTTQNNFKTLGIYPGIPSSTMVGREAWRRVQ